MTEELVARFESSEHYPKITESDEAVAAILEDVCVPALMMSMVHMSGDMRWVRCGVAPEVLGVADLSAGLSPEDQEKMRAHALGVIGAYRDRGCTLPPPPSIDELREMMNVIVGAEVDPAQVDMLIEDLSRRPHDPGGPELAAPKDKREAFPVCVIGCGESGLLAGIRLSREGIPFTILEKNAGVGGTWFENSYPGARVDIANHNYSYSFEPHRWASHFAEQPEIKQYLQDVMDRHEIERHVRWSSTVTNATWDDEAAEWVIHYEDAEGASHSLRARALICAVGQLNRVSIPKIPGKDDFAGPCFHTARWDRDVDIAGKHVAMIGAGASGFQLAPAIADEVASLTIYQRTAQWIAPNALYHEKLAAGAQWALDHLPFYDRWYRFFLAYPITDGAYDACQIDPEWHGDPRSVSETNDLIRQVFEASIRAQVEDPELVAKLVPDYPAMGKRTLQDNGTWFRTLQRGDVELVRDPIETITATGVRTEDDTERPADVIVFATGFQVSRMVWPLEITGRNGAKLDQVWGDSPAAYLGITVPRFPNFFLMYGPATNPVNGGSLFFYSECQMRTILGCIDALIARDLRAIEPKQEVHEDYDRRTKEALRSTVWSHPSIRHSYYKNARGEVHTVQPWRQADYWRWTRVPDLEDYELA